MALPPLPNSLDLSSLERPSPEQLVAQLLAQERQARYHPPANPFGELEGTWRLMFITGTHKARHQARNFWGVGRYLPPWITVHLTYTLAASDRGEMINTVGFGPLTLTVAGPCRWYSPRNLLAFDFTRWSARVGPLPLGQGLLPGGGDREAQFFQTAIARQPFFVFFRVTSTTLAARGRGGGLALWEKQTQDKIRL